MSCNAVPATHLTHVWHAPDKERPERRLHVFRAINPTGSGIGVITSN
jgi:hypothetical protein